MPKVGIVISNYNGWQDTLVCLDSLQKQTFTDFEVILIDDASPNDSVAQLQNKLPPNTVFLPQERNVGFAAANNIGMRRALDDGCDFALLLNNDTSVRPDFLEKLLELDDTKRHIKIVGKKDLQDRTAVVSIQTPKQDMAQVAFRLDSEYGIMTRVGLHCAPNAHKTLGTYPAGTIRFSFGPENTKEELDAAINGLRKILDI